MIYNKRENRPTRAGFGEGLLEAGHLNDNVYALGADITTSVGVDLFARAFPDRFFSLGIAEQNCAGVAAGMALMDKTPVFTTYAVFSAIRATDQIRISICYNNLHVLIGGAHAGISVGPDGATHQALEDIAVMRCLPNMTVISPCDATQASIMTRMAILEEKGPVYLRFGREAVADFTPPELETRIGKAQVLQPGNHLTLIATGHMVWEALKAAEMLSLKGINARVINMHTIKPIDTDAILKAAKETRLIISIEEHQVTGGLGSAIAEVLVGNCPVRMERIGTPDCFGESGKPEELLDKYGLTAEKIARKAESIYRATQISS
jgi:transketolase